MGKLIQAEGLKSEYRLLVEAAICVEGKLRECEAQRKIAAAELDRWDDAVACQQQALADCEARMAVIDPWCGGDGIKAKMLDDLRAQRASIDMKIRELEA